MVSRLDRLFILLDTGSNESVRLAAARQLGEVQRFQPNDLDYLLTRIKEYSGKSVWETRVAAGHATRCVIEQLGTWLIPERFEVGHDHKNQLELAKSLIEQNADTKKILEQFDMEKIISLYPKLLSLDSECIEDSDLPSPSGLKGASSRRGRASQSRKESVSRGASKRNDKEQLMRQRKLINKELGIAMVDNLNLGVKSTDIVSNDDLQTDYNAGDTQSGATKSFNSQQDGRKNLQMSIANYDRVLDILSSSNCLKIPLNPPANNQQKDPASSAEGGTPTHQQVGLWPLTAITKQYSEELFNPSWEMRHGAAIALREIVKLQGKYAGKRQDLPDELNTEMNQLWLVDMSLRALSVLALDKFGDFLFDQVVAPVRENAAQLLGCCMAHMTKHNAFSTIKVILKMLKNQNWETRHGGVLGLKYYLNVVDKSLSNMILEECFDSIFTCLGDSVDDVSAEAAASLVPVKDLLIETIPEKVPKLITFLWAHLANLDELTTSTSNIVLLLASLINSSSAQLDQNELTKSIPKLWPLMGHSSTSVRISVLKALFTLMKTQERTCLSWLPESLMSTALKLVFQRAILENMEEVRPHIEEVWLHLIHIDCSKKSGTEQRFMLLKTTSQLLNYWLCLVMQPSNSPIDRSSPMWLNIAPDGSISTSKPDGEIYIGSCTFNTETINQQRSQVTQCRLLGTRLLGALYANLVNNDDGSQHPKETLGYLSDMFIHYLKTKSANQRLISGWTLESWAAHQIQLFNHNHDLLKQLIPQNLITQINQTISETSLCYDELASTFTRLQQETRDFIAALLSAEVRLDLPVTPDKKTVYNLSQIQMLCELDLESELTEVISKKRATNHDLVKHESFELLSKKKFNLSKSLKSTNILHKSLSTSVLSSMACTYIAWRIHTGRMKIIIQPLLDSIEIEEEQSLQDKSIKYLVMLFDILSQDLEMNKNHLEDTLQRLMNALDIQSTQNLVLDDEGSQKNSAYRIVLLDNLQRAAEQSRSTSRRHSLKRSHSISSTSVSIESESMNDEDSRLQQAAHDVKIRGVNKALSRLAEHFAGDLPEKLPLFWKSITEGIKDMAKICVEAKHSPKDQSAEETKLIRNLKLLEVVGESLDKGLRKHLLDSMDSLILILDSTNPFVRHHSSQCIGVISKIMLNETIGLIRKSILPMLEQEDNTFARCGSIEAIALIIEYLQLDLVPRINMFIINVLRRMSDQNDQVRLMATHCFGKLLSLMPLNLEKSKDTSKDQSREDAELSQQDDKRFIEQLFDQTKLDQYVMPFEMKAELRSYQQDGLNWLAFLNRFKLHGILCDEMGLGKTLMTISMVASDHINSGSSGPSLIVCPSTLTEHWLYEIEKFLPDDIRSRLNPVIYSGAINDRMVLRFQVLSASKVSKVETPASSVKGKEKEPINLVVASYDIVRNDIDFFKGVHWNYCVLDEGHIIKNGKTKLSRAIRLLNAKHRLILSGTPIQNNVTELWSLFDFLMPGFLGSERQFNSRYAKPILQSRELKCSARDLEAGALAMESLHRQVLPFILRRLKEDVLDDLPPKIIQDYYCELSPLQHQLYEDFTRSKLCIDVTKQSLSNLNEEDADLNQETKAKSKSHVFQALQYLKNVCNHPKLVLTSKHSKYAEIKKNLDNEKGSLDDITHSSKLKALKQLLIDCGIGVVQQVGDEQQQQTLELQSVVNQHRALIFCQIRSMVDIIENDLLKKHLPGITYLKLNGAVPPSQRHSIVSRFNNDPSIDVLLLTTQIGGLGLNLTGADTVIFVEHNWNPTKDLQAMDRAHRIGQRKVVNVYRLITKDTLEEKIMGLQKFKTMVSNTVINQDNAGLRTMNVDQLFDLFDDTVRDRDSSAKQGVGEPSEGGKSNNFMDILPELWDQAQYETEYDLSNFVCSLKN